MVATIWNTSDKSANITLSGGSLTATTSSATQGAVRANNSFSSGKLYFEGQIQALVGSAFSIGWANSTAALGTGMGTDKNSIVVQPNNSGAVLFNNVNLGSTGAGLVLQVVRVAVDFGASLWWVADDLGLWNASLTANPATGTGGFSFSTINAGPYFPVFAANGSGASVLANFGATDFDYPVPSGFSGLDSDAQPYLASSKFLGYPVLSPPQNAVSASKFLSYPVVSPPQNAVSASKFLGYAVLLSPPTPQVARYIDPLPPRLMVKQDVLAPRPLTSSATPAAPFTTSIIDKSPVPRPHPVSLTQGAQAGQISPVAPFVSSILDRAPSPIATPIGIARGAAGALSSAGPAPLSIIDMPRRFTSAPTDWLLSVDLQAVTSVFPIGAHSLDKTPVTPRSLSFTVAVSPELEAQIALPAITEAYVGALVTSSATARITEAFVSALTTGPSTGVQISEAFVSALTYVAPCASQRADLWKITRTDGVVFAFTSLDVAISWLDNTYIPCASLADTASENSSDIGSVSSVTLTGILSDESITDADIYAGKFDDAYVEVWVVSWGEGEDVAAPFRTAAGWIGTISFGLISYTAEVLGPGAKLKQTAIVDFYTPGCRWDFGVLDADGIGCPVDAQALAAEGLNLTGAKGRTTLFFDGAMPVETALWDQGKVVWTYGANAGVECQVYAVDWSTNTVLLWDPAPFPPSPGDSFDLLPGCPKDTDSCQTYAVFDFFGGFPDVPGPDALQQSASSLFTGGSGS